MNESNDMCNGLQASRLDENDNLCFQSGDHMPQYAQLSDPLHDGLLLLSRMRVFLLCRKPYDKLKEILTTKR